ncbi:MAG: HAD-IB family phosphatase [Bradymonadales bacterium]|nr:HAD-IB family phosphatase [Bradymonadales bacterium]
MSRNRYRLAAFDVDGTLVGSTVFVWQTLHDYLGTDAESRKKAWDDYFARRIPYSQWFEWDIRLFLEKGANRQRMLEAIDRLVLNRGVKETLETLKAAGMVLVVISGSLDIVLKRFDLERYFDDIFLNEVYFNRAGELIGWRPTPFDLENKAAGLEWLADKHGVALEQTVFVGDNFNDVSIARRAGLSIAFNSSCQELIDCSGVHIPGNDLREILPHICGDRPEPPGARNRSTSK